MTAFAFQWPWLALLLPLPLLWPGFRAWLERRHGPGGVASWVWARADDDAWRRPTLLHPRLAALAAAYANAGSRRDWRRLLTWLIWLGVILALMQPRYLEPHTEISAPGYDLLLAVDASHSMDALDFSVGGRQVSRMAVVKGVLDQFIAARAGDRVGLVIFGTGAYVLAPLTVDRGAVRALLEGLVPSIAGASTALGDAIALGVKKLRDRPESSRVMVLIADGDNTAGGFQPLEAAALARLAGVRIYVIGVGSDARRIPILHQGQIEYWDDLTMDEDLLGRIAQTTGGAYFRATDTQALEAISARIDALEKSQGVARAVYLARPLYRWPLGLALLALLARVFGPPDFGRPRGHAAHG